MEQGHSESLCMYSSSAKCQHSSCKQLLLAARFPLLCAVPLFSVLPLLSFCPARCLGGCSYLPWPWLHNPSAPSSQDKHPGVGGSGAVEPLRYTNGDTHTHTHMFVHTDTHVQIGTHTEESAELLQKTVKSDFLPRNQKISITLKCKVAKMNI